MEPEPGRFEHQLSHVLDSYSEASCSSIQLTNCSLATLVWLIWRWLDFWTKRRFRET